MNIVESLVQRAKDAISGMYDLALEEEQASERRRELEELRKQYDAAMADGVLDEEERSRIAALFSAKGLDPTKLAAEQIDEAIASSETNSAERGFQLGLLSERYTTSAKAASEVLNAEHRAYMTAIENLKA
jgi:uncharacterized membrane protein YebE (DUF533 family)